jgi:RNA ligase (TIGR02306 family)
MANFDCRVTKILDIYKHTNSDNLELIRVYGYQVVATKGFYKKDELVVYLPQGSILPLDIQKKLNVVGLLSGPNKDRLKAIKLRGELSEGMLLKVSELDFECNEGDDVSEQLGIKKYTPKPPVNMSGKVVLVKNFSPTKFDFNSIKKENQMFGDGEQVVITEKLHGTYTNIMVLIDMPKEDGFKEVSDGSPNLQVGVTSKGMGAKGFCINMNEESNHDNVYVLSANSQDFAKAVCGFDFDRNPWSLCAVEIMGETYGTVQGGFLYDCEESNKFRVFDVKVTYISKNGELISHYLSPFRVEEFCQHSNIEAVPTLYKGSYHYSIAMKMAHGNSTINKDQIKEGCVIRPREERETFRGNRVIAKCVSEQYLLRGKTKSGQEPTEFN